MQRNMQSLEERDLIDALSTLTLTTHIPLVKVNNPNNNDQ
jgi:hypothetical protein